MVTPIGRMPDPTPEQLAKQLVRLAHATFDMRSAKALALELDENRHVEDVA